MTISTYATKSKTTIDSQSHTSPSAPQPHIGECATYKRRILKCLWPLSDWKTKAKTQTRLPAVGISVFETEGYEAAHKQHSCCKWEQQKNGRKAGGEKRNKQFDWATFIATLGNPTPLHENEQSRRKMEMCQRTHTHGHKTPAFGGVCVCVCGSVRVVAAKQSY